MLRRSYFLLFSYTSYIDYWGYTTPLDVYKTIWPFFFYRYNRFGIFFYIFFPFCCVYMALFLDFIYIRIYVYSVIIFSTTPYRHRQCNTRSVKWKREKANNENATVGVSNVTLGFGIQFNIRIAFSFDKKTRRGFFF